MKKSCFALVERQFLLLTSVPPKGLWLTIASGCHMLLKIYFIVPADTSRDRLKAFYAGTCHIKAIQFVSAWKAERGPGNLLAATVLFGCCKGEVIAKNNRMWSMTVQAISPFFSAGDGFV